MKKQFFSNEKDGFYGTYYENPKDANCAMIGLFGDDPNDFMAKCGAKWLHKNDVNVMCMAASYFPDITLTFGLTPSDFVWQGFEQGEKDGCKEWPIPDASTLSWQGKPLAYMPFVYAHPEYYHKIEEETKGSGDITRSTHLFIDSEKAREHTEEEMIKVENIKGKLIMVGADDDSFWEAGKYVRRMDKRLKERPHECDYEALTYEHGTHFVLPETMLRKALPVGLKFVMKFIFKAAKDYPKECEQTRKDIDRRLSTALKQWVAE